MDAFNALLGGFATALTPWNLMWRLNFTALGAEQSISRPVEIFLVKA